MLRNDRDILAAEFVGDYQLLVILESKDHFLLSVVFMDTEKNTGGAPVKTSFHLPDYFRGFRHPFLLLERGMHKPSSAECLAPFHHDHTQRIAAVSAPKPYGYLVFPVEALLRLVKDREGCKIGWDEWKVYVMVATCAPGSGFVVSGCRLFCMTSSTPTLDAEVEMYDFSMGGRAKYLSEQVDADLGGVRCLASMGTKARFPCRVDELFNVSGSHDSVVFYEVSILLSCCTTRLSDVTCCLVAQ